MHKRCINDACTYTFMNNDVYQFCIRRRKYITDMKNDIFSILLIMLDFTIPTSKIMIFIIRNTHNNVHAMISSTHTPTRLQ